MMRGNMSSEPSSPTPTQQARLNRLNQFNKLYVYLPLGIGLLLCVGLVGWLTWSTAIAPLVNIDAYTQQNQALVSGLGDSLFILLSLPLLVMMWVLPLAIFAGIYYARQEGYKPLQKLQRGFWWLENHLLKADSGINQVANKVSDKVISANSRLKQTETHIKGLLKEQEGKI
jgi:hypothetical protein